jgi:hypothetical protein
MCAQMLTSHARSQLPRMNHLESERPRVRLANWTSRLAAVNLVIAAATVLRWPGSLVALAVGAFILAELLVVAFLYGLIWAHATREAVTL